MFIRNEPDCHFSNLCNDKGDEMGNEMILAMTINAVVGLLCGVFLVIYTWKKKGSRYDLGFHFFGWALIIVHIGNILVLKV